MKNRLMAASLTIALLGCALLSVMWIDNSISLAYARQSEGDAIRSVQSLERLLGKTWIGMSEDDVLERLQTEAARHPTKNIVVKKEANVIWFDEIRFNFERGKLASIGSH